MVVVSEESSQIAIAKRGMLKRGMTADQVGEALASRERGGLAFAGARDKASPA